jgi:dUTP pyrophosphatase
VEVKFKKIRGEAREPKRHNHSDAGYDLFSCGRHVLNPMERKLISIGIAIEIPFGYYGRIAPRSGLAIKSGIDTMAGVIDAGFRNEIGVVLINLNLPEMLFEQSKNSLAFSTMFGDKDKFTINPGDRIAQLVIERCYSADWKQVEELHDSSRGLGGFGSTGI